MATIRRVVFGEPCPGFARFAALLQVEGRLAQSDAYCNRGATGHDLITDLPWSIPPALDFRHPTPLRYLTVAPRPDDPWLAFRYHHVELYEQGVSALAQPDPVAVEAVQLCRAIYAKPGDPAEKWDERLATDGVDWALKVEGGRGYVVFRGSDDVLDWVRDFTAFDPDVLLRRLFHHDAFGPMWDGFLVGMDAAWAAIEPLLAGLGEVVFTGHSLGAARADIAAAHAALNAES